MIHDIPLEQTACPLCDSDAAVPRYSFQPYLVQQCEACGLHYLSPRLQEEAMLAIYSDSSYFEGEGSGYTTYAEQELALRLTFRRFLRALAQRGLAGGSLLEVGCGYGYLLDEARTYFPKRAGTDFSAEAARQTRRYTDEVYVGGVDALPGGQRFDCIVANNVIEHVYRPREFIAELKGRLRPGGALVLATPYMGSFWRRVMGRRWPSFKTPEHVLYFDRQTLRRLLIGGGLQRFGVLPYPHAFPAALVAAKLKLSLPPSVGALSVWLPQTMIAAYAHAPHE